MHGLQVGQGTCQGVTYGGDFPTISANYKWLHSVFRPRSPQIRCSLAGLHQVCWKRERQRAPTVFELFRFDRHGHRSNKLTSVTTSSGKSLEAVPSIANSLHIILALYSHVRVCACLKRDIPQRGRKKIALKKKESHNLNH